ncbi:uncharacterized protein LOC130584621 [Malurus melanocephalus]|uniref:uncharacterized protein LOC130584621 n=1 Tax=Malurus melanocephalus TaxID=175006 RepID=UPI0025483EFC|nr:uncharacterized protein LOC130584621 [Malurus melanocephalus]
MRMPPPSSSSGPAARALPHLGQDIERQEARAAGGRAAKAGKQGSPVLLGEQKRQAASGSSGTSLLLAPAALLLGRAERPAAQRLPAACHAQAAGGGWQLAGGPLDCGTALQAHLGSCRLIPSRDLPWPHPTKDAAALQERQVLVATATGPEGGGPASAGPFALRWGRAEAAQAPWQEGCGCSRTLFGQPLAAVCVEDGTLPQPIQVRQPGEGQPISLFGCCAASIPTHVLQARVTGLFSCGSASCSQPLGSRRQGARAGEELWLWPLLLEQPSSSHKVPALVPLLQDLLVVLHHQGPTTEGVFHKAESTGAVQKLRQALDHGLPVC